MERVKTRVKEGGHNIPEDVIERRYYRGIANLFGIYLPVIDHCYIFDNSEGKHILIAEKKFGEEIEVIEKQKFNTLKNIYNERR